LSLHKNRKLHRILFLNILCITALAITTTVMASGDRQKGETEIRFWHSIGSYNKEVLSSLIDTFNQNQKQVTVKGIFQGSAEDLYLKLLSQENLPDVALIPIQLLPLLNKKGLIIPIDAYIPEKLKDDITPKYWGSVTIGDSIYGIPFSFTTYTLFVNQHLLRISGTRNGKEPGAWKDIIPLTRRIKENLDGKWGIFIPMESTLHFVSFIKSYTGKSPITDGRLVLNAPETVNAVRFLQNLVFTYQYMPPKMTVSDAEQMFLSSNLCILMAASDSLVYMKSNLPYDLTLWHLPSADNARPTVSGTCLALLKSNAKRENFAFRFLEYLTSYESIVKWHTHTGTPAIRTSVKDSIDLLVFYEDNPNYTTATIEMERGDIFNPEFDYFAVNTVVKNALDKILINGEDATTILEEAQREIDRMDASSP